MSRKEFNMIEILIAVSIMVTFSTLVGTVYYKKLEEAKEAFTKIELNNIMSALILYESRNGHYPLDLNELVVSGDLTSLKRDPWNNEFHFVPHVDWSKIIELVESKQESLVKPHMDAINLLSRSLSNLPAAVDPINILTASSKGAFVFSGGNRTPIFPQDVLDISRERTKSVLEMIKSAREKAGFNLLQSINSLNVNQ